VPVVPWESEHGTVVADVPIGYSTVIVPLNVILKRLVSPSMVPVQLYCAFPGTFLYVKATPPVRLMANGVTASEFT
jgi:hypothetical protein